MFKFSYNCTEALIYSREAYENLYKFYDKLEEEANRQKGIADYERAKAAEYKAEYAKEKNKKKRWRKIAIVEGAGLAGIIALFILL